MSKLKNVVLILIAVIFVFFTLLFGKWNENVYHGDSWGYYSYLPSVFIYHDLGSYDSLVSVTKKYNPNFSDPLLDPYGLYHKHPVTGKHVIKYTNGVSLMLMPFFGIAHSIALISDYPSDGFSDIYKIGVSIGVIIWVLIGLWCLYQLLRKYFDESVVLLTISSLALATNVFHNVTMNPVMSHALLFSLYAILMYLSERYYTFPTWQKALGLGLIAGLISLTRLTELYCLAIPLLWNITTIKERLDFFRNRYKDLIFAATSFLLVFIPQILYWKILTGQFVFNGYVGEYFHFDNPKIWQGFFSFDNGWLIWSPVMAFSLVGLFFIKNKIPFIFYILIFIFPLHVYITYSWWCSNYINGFGSRPMEHMYPLLSFPLALIFFLVSKIKFGKMFVIGAAGFFIILNVFQNWQTSQGILMTNFSNPAYYYQVLWKTKSDQKVLAARSSGVEQPDHTTGIKILFSDSMENTKHFTNLSSDFAYQSTKSLVCSDESVVFLTIPKDSLDEGKYVKISFMCYFGQDVANASAVWDLPFVYAQFRDVNGKNLFRKDQGIYPFQFIGNPTNSIYSLGDADDWGKASYFVKIPSKNYQDFILALWNPKKSKFYMDNLEVELHK